ncbi:Peptidase_C1 domain containing protein [uncultured Caudovirales phage]|uniref:Peptidase_C1 domain containing protein n=1 Tax=uncultured Caudovirales phage TaxID=2100421 RepID=A0A6J5TCZ4_9CAUD|nr:Peptidase_C1 domain containing protein [uncultured Caudovirales phage]
MEPRKYKLSADHVDWRDRFYNFARSTLKESVDMRPMASNVEEQSALGSCTAQAIVGAYELLLKRDYPEQFVELSRLFVYYNGRVVEGSPEDEDQGIYIRDGIKSVDQFGICQEHLWPYQVDMFSTKPSVESYNDAATRKIKRYYRIAGLADVLDALSNHHPVVAGITVYAGFDHITNSNPVLAMPADNEVELGGHAVVFVGYDLAKKLILVRNSFGSHWGEHGYFWIPFAYIEQDLTDAWIFDIKIAEKG